MTYWKDHLRFKVKVDQSKLLAKYAKFKKKAISDMAKTIGPAILDALSIGRSPVDRMGKFQKYAQSYIDQIKMKKAFRRTRNGGFIVWEKLSNQELKQYRASDEAKAQNKDVGEMIYRMNKEFADYGKTPSPVNLKVTGDLINSLKVKEKGDRVNIRFDNEKFVYHNNEGVGKAKVKRRMLPTESGERFNLTINTTLRESLTRLIQKIFT